MKENIAGMIFHPPNISTIDETVFKLFPWLREIYKRIPLVTKKYILPKIPAFQYFYVRDIESRTGQRVSLLGFMLPMLPDQIMTEKKERVVQRILDIINRAQKLGVKIITLGSFTSIVTDQGKDIEKHAGISITSGNTYTAAICVNSILKLCEKLGINLEDVSMSIIGATGDIGSICAKIFSRKVRQLVLCSRGINKDSKIVLEIEDNFRQRLIISDDPQKAIISADIVICSTSAFVTLFNSENIPRGCIVCDLSMPPNVARDIINTRKDVIAFEGGRAKMLDFENINNKWWSTLFPYNSIYGCLAESLILAFEEKYENYSIGRGTILEEKVSHIYELGLKHGFDVADFSCSGYFYEERDFVNFRKTKQIRQ